MPETNESDIQSEAALLRRISAQKAVNVDFFRFLLDQLRGAELVVEDESEVPVHELRDIIEQVALCAPKLRERYLITRLCRLRCWSYQAINENREVWRPWKEAYRCFEARSTRIDWFESEVGLERDLELSSWLEGVYRGYVEKNQG